MSDFLETLDGTPEAGSPPESLPRDVERSSAGGPIRPEVPGYLGRLRAYSRFKLAYFVIVVAIMALLGPLVEWQVATRLIRETARATSPYVNALLDPDLQELARGGELSAASAARITAVLQRTIAGKRIRALKVWDPGGRILYSTNPSMVNRRFPVDEKLARALGGKVYAGLTRLDEPENGGERHLAKQLLEVYTPVRVAEGEKVFAVIEFFLRIDDLQEETIQARWWTWVTFAISVLLVYLVVSALFRKADRTIEQQSSELRDRLAELSEALSRNEALTGRIRDAAATATTLNESYLRRIGADLHDGPAQHVAFSLMRLDRVVERVDACKLRDLEGAACHTDVASIRDSLGRGLEELRAISAGLGVPGLDDMTLAGVLARVIRDHEKRTGTSVRVEMDGRPLQVLLPAKIVVYRLIQEALNNAFVHGGGVDQAVRVSYKNECLVVGVSDGGPGFDVGKTRALAKAQGDRLGLLGMQERVESLGGSLTIDSDPADGTKITAVIPLKTGEAS